MSTYRALAPSSTVLALALLVAPAASATTISIPVGAFGPGSTLTTFTGLPAGSMINGFTVDGILFQYSLGPGCPMPSPPCGGPLAISDIFGITNNLNPPSVVAVSSAANLARTLTLTFPSLIDAFGYGFAVGATTSVPNATTVTLFSGATAVGSLSYNGTPDPVIAGGFAGIQSTIAFDSAQIVFDTTAFALDNVRTIPSSTAVVPEPGTVLLVAAGALMATRWRRKRGSDSC